MATVIVEQFNPIHGYWNKLYEVDSADFDPDAPITVNKYGGPYRTRFIGVQDAVPEFVEDKLEEKIEVVFADELEEEEIEEDPSKFDDSRW